MGLLTPWFLAGLAAIAVPVLVHLVAREERTGRPFPSLMFLRRIPHQVRRRRTLRDLGLLALRSLALALLAVAFAGPHGPAGPAASLTEPRRVDRVLLVDRSYSMDDPERWRDALAAARARIDALGAGERAALVVFDVEPHVVEELTGDGGRLRAALARIRPGPGATDYASALAGASRLLAESRGAGRQVVLISDLQETGLAGIRTPRLDEEIALDVVPVGAATKSNAAVMDVSLVHESAAPSGARRSLAARVRNTGLERAPAVRFRAEVDGHETEARVLDLEAGAETRVEFPVVITRDRPTRVRVQVGPDGVAADDDFTLVLADDRPVAVLLVEPDDGRDPGGFFLQQALALARAPAVAVSAIRVGGLTAEALAAADAVILDDVPLPGGPRGEWLAAFVARGGGVLVVAAEGPRGHWAGGADGFLPGALGSAVDRSREIGRIVELADDHPLLAPFGTSLREGLTGAEVYRYRALRPDPRDRVLAHFDDGAPALVERTGTGGRVLVVTTTLDARWSSLAAEPAFAPLVIEMVRYLADRPRLTPSQWVGRPVDLARIGAALPGGEPLAAHRGRSGHLVIESPSQHVHRLAADAPLFSPSEPGFYEIHGAGPAGTAVPMAVNADRVESNLSTLTPEAFLARIQRPRWQESDAPQAAAPERPRAAAPDALWWYVLAAAAVVLAGEALLANVRSWRPGDTRPGTGREGRS